MSFKNLALTSISLLLMSCASMQDVNKNHITFEPVYSAYENYENSIKEKRMPLMFSNSLKSENCTEYFELKKNEELIEDEANFLVAQCYVVCDTLLAVKQADQNFNVELAGASLGNILSEKLDLSSFRSSLARKVTDSNYTLSAVSAGLIEISDYTAIYETNDWYYELKVVARIDANADGTEDWLVWVTDKAKAGSYSTIKGYVLYDAFKSERLTLNKL